MDTICKHLKGSQSVEKQKLRDVHFEFVGVHEKNWKGCQGVENREPAGQENGNGTQVGR